MRRIKKFHGPALTEVPQFSLEELGMASGTPSLFPHNKFGKNRLEY